MTTAASHAGRTRTGGIDGLRAIAMTMVIAQHCGLLPFGWMGVWLFYVISGYVISLGFEGAVDAAGAPTRATRWIDFWQRRAVRLLPAYALYLCTCGVVLLATGRETPWRELPWLLVFLQNWHMTFSTSGWPPFGHLWTLSVEQQFYLLFPLIALGLHARRRVQVSVLLIALGPLLRAAWSAWLGARGMAPGAVAFGVYAASHVQVDAFLMGSLLARAQATQSLAGDDGRAWSRRLWTIAAVAATAYASTYVTIDVVQRGARGVAALHDVFSGVLYGEGREDVLYSVVSLVASALVLHVITHAATGRLNRVLEWSPCAWVGRVSYAGYLFHLLVLWSLGEALGLKVRDLSFAPRLMAFVAVLAATLLLAALSQRLVEAPALRWFRRSRTARPPALARGVEAAT